MTLTAAHGAATSPPLLGREPERAALDALVRAVRGGQGRAVVLAGEPGIGKSALVDDLAHRAEGDVRVLRVTGVQAEMELPFAGLHQLLGGVSDRAERLPPPQRAALLGALGLGDHPANPLLVALAVLGVLSDLSTDAPLLCVVDDAQWLDRESVRALSFTARRLRAEAVGLVFAAREVGPELAGLPLVTVTGLRTADAGALLDRAVAAPLDPAVRHLLVTETRGNPLALLELSRGVSATDLGGGFGLPGAAPLAEHLEAGYRRRLVALPADSRQLVVVAAADVVGDPTVLWQAADHLGLPHEALSPAVAAGLLTVGARVEFRHPLARSAIYRGADDEARRRAHGALAAVTDPDQDPDRRAWHAAQAVVGPDEAAAAALERSARRAEARGGVAAAATFLDRAAVLTADPARRVRRLIEAAALLRDAGALDRALVLLDAAEAGPVSEEQAAAIVLARGVIALGRHHGSDGVRLLVTAAHRLRTGSQAHATLLEAVMAAMFVLEEDQKADLVGAARILDDVDPDSTLDLLLEARLARVTHGFTAAAPALRRALDAAVADARAPDPPMVSSLATLWGILSLPNELWDAPARRLLITTHIDVARSHGALTLLHGALAHRPLLKVAEGDVDGARLAVEEGQSIAQASGAAPWVQTRLMVAAWAGDEDETRRLARAVRGDGAGPPGASMGSLDTLLADYAETVLDNAAGRADAALRRVVPLFERDFFAMGPWILPELVDAAAQTGATAELVRARDWMEQQVAAAPTPWSIGLAERVRALTTDGDAAGEHFRLSIDHLLAASVTAEVARSHLLCGEWLRRRGARADARHHLRQAEQAYLAMGAGAFAARATRALRATGAAAVVAEAGDRALTAQERGVARLAADGLTNPEIGARLYLSPRTVQYHLRKVFSKLGIGSRHELAGALGPPDDA
ncbi:LuxR family transcriptional regulator [Actinomycetospora chlora]|uniref:LuxR family transcriptional regulator n=1 Tax=Actinomycetospora chlora TaxID=663608 RepID=A0ABP9B4L8_9PSEU